MRHITKLAMAKLAGSSAVTVWMEAGAVTRRACDAGETSAADIYLMDLEGLRSVSDICPVCAVRMDEALIQAESRLSVRLHLTESQASDTIV